MTRFRGSSLSDFLVITDAKQVRRAGQVIYSEHSDGYTRTRTERCLPSAVIWTLSRSGPRPAP